ncbi:MAG: hypothetical protein GXO42_02235 [bacterium]|nr:hypothetical protein [bacterium]
MRIACISHRDLDGLACVAVLQRYYSSVIYSTVSYRQFFSALKKIAEKRLDTLYITDLGFRPGQEVLALLRGLRQQGCKVIVVDHHCWRAADLQALKAANIDVFVDQNVCAALGLYRLLSKELGRDSKLERVLEIVNDVDLWKLRCGKLTVKWFVVSASPAASESFLLEKLKSCTLWDEELEQLFRREYSLLLELVRSIVENFEKHYVNLGNYKLLLVKLPPRLAHQHTVLAELLRRKLQRKEIDVMAFFRPDGCVSLRAGTTSKCPDLAAIARKLGGGGHKKAAGLSLRYGWLDKLRYRLSSGLPKKELLLELFR